jgi:hypothetical protein
VILRRIHEELGKPLMGFCDSVPRPLPAAEIESAIERVTLSASPVEIALADAADVEEQDRRLVLPWTNSVVAPVRRQYHKRISPCAGSIFP